MKNLLIVLLAVTACAFPAHAQEALPLKMSTTLELRAAAEHVTGGLGDWSEAAVLATHATGAHVLQGELSAKHRFHASGRWAGILDTYTIDPDWYVAAGVGAGDGAFFLPRVRADAFLFRKLGAERRLVLFVGPGYARFPDGHVDRMWTLGGIYYFESPWVVQGGVRFNESDPGSVRTRQQFVALSYGREGRDQLTLRAAGGREGYQPIAQSAALVDFPSREASLQWRHWNAPRTGFSLGFDHYRNPYYERSGAVLAWFGTW